MAKEAESLFAAVVEKFGCANDRESDLAKDAEAELYEIRGLAIGKTAPEITGEDLNGRPMKLSDYRGKVVVLDFWGDWCGPCRAMYPHERSLVNRLDGKPFALLGINSDSDPQKLKARMKEENVTWPFWRDGGAQKVRSPLRGTSTAGRRSTCSITRASSATRRPRRGDRQGRQHALI